MDRAWPHGYGCGDHTSSIIITNDDDDDDEKQSKSKLDVLKGSGFAGPMLAPPAPPGGDSAFVYNNERRTTEQAICMCVVIFRAF